MSAKYSNIFPKIYNTIGAFGDLNLLGEINALTGRFKTNRRTNKRGIKSVRATFFFNDDIVSGIGFKKAKFRDKISNSLFGDAQNPRKVRSGNKKFDYFNGSLKLVELSVESEFFMSSKTAKQSEASFESAWMTT